MNKFLLIVFLLIDFFLLWLWQKDITFWQKQIIETYQLDTLQTEKLTNNLLTPKKYLLLKILMSSVVLFAFALLFWQKKKIVEIFTDFLDYLQTQFKTFLKLFQNLPKTEFFRFGFIFCLLNGYVIFQLHHKIPHIDEAFSYVHFSSKGFLVSALYYPNPNNHIFYNLCVAFWDIFLPNKIWAMRLPSLLSFLVLQILVFRFFLKNYSFSVALQAFLAFTLLSPVQAYSIMGRGYLLQMLFLWLAITFLHKIDFRCISASLNAPKTNIFEPKSSNRIKQILFIAFSWAGFYTIPTYLYYFLAIGFLAIVMALSNYRKIIIFIEIHYKIIFLVFLTYLPVFLLNGKENLFSESWQIFAQEEFSRKKYEYFANFGDFWVGLEHSYPFFWGMVGVSVIGFLLRRNDRKSYLFVAMPFVALMLMFLQQILLPERIWLGLAFSWVVLLVLMSQFLKKYANILLILMVLGEVFVQFYQTSNQKNEGYANFVEVYPTIPFERGQKIFSNDLIYQNLLAFYNLQDHKGLEIDYSHKSKPYEWIILEKNKNLEVPKNYFLWKETPFVMIFKQN